MAGRTWMPGQEGGTFLVEAAGNGIWCKPWQRKELIFMQWDDGMTDLQLADAAGCREVAGFPGEPGATA